MLFKRQIRASRNLRGVFPKFKFPWKITQIFCLSIKVTDVKFHIFVMNLLNIKYTRFTINFLYYKYGWESTIERNVI